MSNVKNQLDELICCALDDELTLPDIVGKLTYTMSDRAANEKKADRLLGEWKTEVVGDQQARVVHKFYCMAHALLGFHRLRYAQFLLHGACIARLP